MSMGMLGYVWRRAYPSPSQVGMPPPAVVWFKRRQRGLTYIEAFRHLLSGMSSAAHESLQA